MDMGANFVMLRVISNNIDCIFAGIYWSQNESKKKLKQQYVSNHIPTKPHKVPKKNQF